MLQCTDIIQHQNQQETAKNFTLELWLLFDAVIIQPSQLHTCAAAYLTVEVNTLPQFSV